MPSAPPVSIFIDSLEVRVAQGTSILEAAKSVGIEIPHYCYHHALPVAGNCRMCLVEMGLEQKDRATGQTLLDENGKAKIAWLPRLQLSCATYAAAGQHFRTNTPAVHEARKAVMEFLLANHPLDCPICDQAGECQLQEYAADYGRGTSRFAEEKNAKPKRVPLGPRVMLDAERCILCGRCIRFMRDVMHEDVLGFIKRGSRSELACFPGRALESNYSLNTVDLCPVGALTSTDFRFKMRAWFLKETPSISTESSAGVNVTVHSREGEIYRLTPRRNDAVNADWMSDSGRLLYKANTAPSRLTQDAPEALETLCKVLAKLQNGAEGGLAVVASPYQCLESQYLLSRLVKILGPVRVEMVSHLKESDGFLVSADRSPNMRGAFLTGLAVKYPKPTFEGLKADLAAKKIRNILVLREDLLAGGITREELQGVNVWAIDTHETPTTALAQLVVPVSTVFERSGSFVNRQWRVQRFLQAVPPRAGIVSAVAFFDRILQRLGEAPLPAPTPEAVWKLMAATIPQLKGLSFASLGNTGVPLDASAFAPVEFPEGKGLNYEPSVLPDAM